MALEGGYDLKVTQNFGICSIFDLIEWIFQKNNLPKSVLQGRPGKASQPHVSFQSITPNHNFKTPKSIFQFITGCLLPSRGCRLLWRSRGSLDSMQSMVFLRTAQVMMMMCRRPYIHSTFFTNTVLLHTGWECLEEYKREMGWDEASG